MQRKTEEVRFLCVEGNTQEGMARLSKFMSGTHKIKPINFYTPPHNEKLVVFQFSNAEEKEKLLLIEDLDAELLKIKCKIFKPNTLNDPTLAHRMVFIYGLNPCYFC